MGSIKVQVWTQNHLCGLCLSVQTVIDWFPGLKYIQLLSKRLRFWKDISFRD